mmetsp:Transcript_117416/g.339476  ORF Transcript_117416/g.339476 Transcript_117416/m.339476 type:complete len:316 (-) Transcript_117416:334-1281(-)
MALKALSMGPVTFWSNSRMRPIRKLKTTFVDKPLNCATLSSISRSANISAAWLRTPAISCFKPASTSAGTDVKMKGAPKERLAVRARRVAAASCISVASCSPVCKLATKSAGMSSNHLTLLRIARLPSISTPSQRTTTAGCTKETSMSARNAVWVNGEPRTLAVKFRSVARCISARTFLNGTRGRKVATAPRARSMTSATPDSVSLSNASCKLAMINAGAYSSLATLSRKWRISNSPATSRRIPPQACNKPCSTSAGRTRSASPARQAMTSPRIFANERGAPPGVSASDNATVARAPSAPLLTTPAPPSNVPVVG